MIMFNVPMKRCQLQYKHSEYFEIKHCMRLIFYVSCHVPTFQLALEQFLPMTFCKIIQGQYHGFAHSSREDNRGDPRMKPSYLSRRDASFDIWFDRFDQN